MEVSLHNHIKISFKNGLENSFLYSIKEVIQTKKWENHGIPASLSSLPLPRVTFNLICIVLVLYSELGLDNTIVFTSDTKQNVQWPFN